MKETHIVRSMRRLILESYAIVEAFPQGAAASAQDLERWLCLADKWNETVQMISQRLAYLRDSEVAMLHEAQHFHTPVHIALSEQANVIFAAWFQAQSKIYDKEKPCKRREKAH